MASNLINDDAEWQDVGLAAPARQPSQQDEWSDVTPQAKAGAQDEWGDVTEKPKAESSFFNPSKNNFKNKGVWQTIKDSFSTDKDPEARAMLQSMAYPGGVIGNAGLEAIKRVASGGSEGLGAGEWEKTLQGDATPAPETLQKKFGMGKIGSHVAGLPYSVLTDPMGGIFAKGLKAKPTIKMLEALLQQRPNTGTVDALSQPLGSQLQKMGKKIFANPFRKVDAELATKYKNGGGNAHPFTDELWNEGNPSVGGFSKTNPEIGQEITGLRREAGKRIGDRIAEAGHDVEIDLAPKLQENANTAMIDSLSPDTKELPDALEWLKEQIGSKNKMARQKGIEVLAQSAPELSDIILKNGKHLANSGTRPGMVSFYHNLIDDLAEGPRGLEGLQDLKVAQQQAAAASQTGNPYTHNQGFSAPKTAEAQAAGEFGNTIDDITDMKLNDSSARAADKSSYSTLRRGVPGALRVIRQEEGRPKLGTLAPFVILEELLRGNPKTAAAALAVKGGDMIRKSPRAATGTGKLLNQAGKSNVWDNMLRKQLLNSSQNNGGNE